jgi:hypothetical protein
MCFGLDLQAVFGQYSIQDVNDVIGIFIGKCDGRFWFYCIVERAVRAQ